MVIHCTGIALQCSLSLHTVRAPFSWTHQSACVKLLAQKSDPCFRALAVAFDPSKDECLRLLAAHRRESRKKTLFDAVSSWRYFKSAAGRDRERHEEQINRGRKQNKGWRLPQRMTGAGYFHHFGVSLWVSTGIALGIALKPWIPLSSPCLNLPFSTACVAVRNPVRRRTKRVEETKKGSKKGERERERDDKEVVPWPATHNPQLENHPSKGTWTPAHDLHQKSFFLHVRCLKVFNGVSRFNFPYRFTQ